MYKATTSPLRYPYKQYIINVHHTGTDDVTMHRLYTFYAMASTAKEDKMNVSQNELEIDVL
jgi:hypothetical protein